MKVFIVTTVIVIDDGEDGEDESPAPPVPNPKPPHPFTVPETLLRKLFCDVRSELNEENYGTFFKG